MQSLPDCKTLIILDIEYTAWEGSQEREYSEPWEEMEVIQIAMLAVDRQTLAPINHFSCLVKPTINPELSDYIQKLTGITQHEMDRDGLSLLEAFIEAVEFHQQFDTPCEIVSNGNDGEIMTLNGEMVGVEGPSIFKTAKTIRPYLGSYVDPHDHGFSSGDLADLVGRPLEGHKHNALYDVHAIAVALRYIRDLQESAA